MSTSDHVVFLLDDDHASLDCLQDLLLLHGYKVSTFTKSGDFLAGDMPAYPSCLILEHQFIDGLTGAQVHSEIRRRGWKIPTIFLTARWDVPLVVNAIKAGAVGFLTKPFSPVEVLEAVDQALQKSRENTTGDPLENDARLRTASLTKREKEIVCLVATGLLNKEIAEKLDLALVTVKVHRGSAMRKLGAGNPAELIRIATIGGLFTWQQTRG